MKRRADVEGLLCILDTGCQKECIEAINILGEIKDRKSINPLIGSLGTDDIQIRSTAAWALGELGDAKAVLPLIGLLNDPIENVRIHAAWALGRIGDRRAITGLTAAMKYGSRDLRKRAREAIDRIESEKNKNQKSEGGFSQDVDIPLVMLDVHSDLLKCDYVCRGNNGGTGTFSEDVIIKDTRNQFPGESPRRIVLGLKNDFHGSVSVDIIFRYRGSNGEEVETSSVWLQMSSIEKNGSISESPMLESAPDLYREREEQLEELRRREHNRKKTEIRHKRPVEFEIPFERIQVKAEKPAPEPIKEPIKPETIDSQPVKKPTAAASPPAQVEVDVNSAVTLLSNIGMSGMTNAASIVTQLSGQEAESLQSQMRTIPIDQIHEEIISIGESVVMIEIELHGKGEAGDVDGRMQLYLSKDNALDIANELLCNPPNAYCREFNDDITSTLKETTNIFGGQYISAISEYIGVPLLLKAPTFKDGHASRIVESIVAGITGKVEFALATDIQFGNNKSGRLILLFDPKSFETIIHKLF